MRLCLENEEQLDLAALVASWPPGLEGCIVNIVFQSLSEAWGRVSEWKWLDEVLPQMQPGTVIGDKLWFTVGLHPKDAARWNADTEQRVRGFLKHPRCIGIGECGMDFSFKHRGREEEEQYRAFQAQVKLAVECRKALVVHARKAEADCLDVLTQLLPPEHPVHLHCYTDSLGNALELCDRFENLRVGFTGCITFGADTGSRIRAPRDDPEHFASLVRGIPLERLLIETDGPYMCPEPFRGQTAHPGHVHRVAERIADLKQVPLVDVIKATRASTRTVYGI